MQTLFIRLGSGGTGKGIIAADHVLFDLEQHDTPLGLV